MLVFSSFNFKLLFLLLLAISLGLPLNNSIDLTIVVTGILFIHNVKIREIIDLSYYKIILLITIVLAPNYITSKTIEEANSSFLSNADIKILSNFLPNNIIYDLKKNYNLNFDIDRLFKSTHKFEHPKYTFKDYNSITKPYSFSSDNFFTRSKFTRFVKKINFSSRENLRLGQFNSLEYNFQKDKEFRRILPYYVLYKIPNSYSNSTLCAKGNAYFAYSNFELSNIKKINFNRFEKNCITIDTKSKNLYIFGYSINDQDNLEIKLNKDFFNLTLGFFEIIFQLALFIFFYKFIFNFKTISKFNYAIFFLSIFSTILFIYFKDINLLTGLRYFRGGADGLFHEFQGTEIVKNLYNFNFFEVFRGGRDVYYMMPGLRYFIAIGKIVFGDTSYAYIIVGLLLPIYLFELCKNLISEKISFYILILFLILPILENMGFGYFNFIHQIMRNHAETLSITIIIFCLAKISSSKFFTNLNYITVFFYCFLLAFATFCRPNFFPTTTIIFLYIFYISFHKSYILSLLAAIGYSFIFFSLFHNIYFGDSFSLFTKSSIHFIFTDSYQNVNISNIKDNFITHQILKWNPLYNLHRLIILVLVIIFFLRNKKTLIISVLFTSAILQHIVLLLTHADARYAYLAWMITLICFFYYLFNNYLKRLK